MAHSRINLIKLASRVGRIFLIAFFPSNPAPMESNASGEAVEARYEIPLLINAGK